MSTYLVHHGIEGQRWGVRNGPPYPLSRSKSAKVKDRVYVKGYMKSFDNKDFYKDLSHERAIKKNSTVYEVSESGKASSKGTKVVLSSSDAYVGASFSNTKKSYVKSYKTKKDLKIPSVQKMSEILADTVLSDKKAKKEYLSEYKNRTAVRRHLSPTNTTRDKIMTELDYINNKYLNFGKRKFEQMLKKDPNKALVMAYSSIFNSNNKSIGRLGSDLQKKLEAAGYDGIPNMSNVSENYQTSYYIFNGSNSLAYSNKVKAGEKLDYKDPDKESYAIQYLDTGERRRVGKR